MGDFLKSNPCELILSLLMVFNIGLAAVGTMTGIRALRMVRGRERRSSRHLLWVAIILCVSFVLLDVMWYAQEFIVVVGFWTEFAWRMWQIGAIGFATYVCCEQSKCLLVPECPRGTRTCQN